ncbi:MATE efflux family protein [Roseivivax marinus]|jgi:MATE family multidrug resistance protein|uniref:MATE efflux family protein n=1 Tax=Roseivivax marinus TaxID=1379903 RepID=W4HFZ7_9RHOB|nr:MATE family efflux transporter [Roseivivax marinus]ETW11692.1 MATE efflux family protein [Roseivivax marinus]UMA65581.1 MATE family efflux transporter [Roseivivax marinus]
MAEAAADVAAPRDVTHGRVLRIALPIVASNATIPILGAVDTGVVGQLGEAAPIGAVGIGAVILSGIYWIFGFLRMGTTGLAAQAEGQGDRAEVAAILTRVLMIGLAAGTAFILLRPLIFWGAFAISPASEEVERLARGYMGIRIWSAPAAIAIYGLLGWLIAKERTGAVLALQVWMNGVNMVLDLVFVLGFGWGVNGVAFATFLSEWSGLALGLWLCRAAFRVPDWRDWPRVFDRVRLTRMAQVNSDILIRSLLLQSIFMSFLLFASDLGDVTLAATQVLLQFLQIVAYGLDGFAFAAEAMVGQAMGARSVAILRRASVLSSLWALVASVMLSVAFWVLGPWIIDVMAESEDVRAAARLYLPWMVAAPVVGLASWMLDGLFIGATRTADMRNMMVISAAGYFAAVFALMPLMGMHGLWAAMLLSFVFRAITLGLRYPALERAAA